MAPDALLHVTDLHGYRQFRVIPRNAGKERDFYRIRRDDGGDEQVVERWLADTIDADIGVLRDIDLSAQLPTGDALKSLMMFIASSVLRAPNFRRRVDAIVDSTIRDVLTHLSDDEEAFARFVGTIPPGIVNDTDVISLLKRYVSNPKMRLSFEQSYHVKQMLGMIPGLASVLSQRSWHVIQCREPTFSFVCSDNPASLLSTDAVESPAGTAFGARHTILFFPVTRRTALVGTYGNEAYTLKEKMTRCAIINAHTVANAVRFVYSPEAEIVWMDGNEIVRGTNELLDMARSVHR